MKQLKGFALLLILLLAALAPAQDAFDVHCANVTILQDRKVQNEIGVSQAQRDKMNVFAQQHQAKLQVYGKTLNGKQPDMKVLTGYMQTLQKNVVGVLSAAQVKRLRELNLQAAGLLGLLDPVVAKRVGIGEPQRKKMEQAYVSGKNEAGGIVRDAIAPIDKKYQALATKYKGKEKASEKELTALRQAYVKEVQAKQKQIEPRVTAITKSTEKKMRALLTPAQNSAWVALQGKKFTPK